MAAVVQITEILSSLSFHFSQTHKWDVQPSLYFWHICHHLSVPEGTWMLYICLTQHTRNTFPQENRRPGKKFIYELALTSFSIRVTGLGHIRVWTHCNAVLSSLPDNPGASRFWTLSPSLQIRVWSLLDDRQSCSFCRLDFPTIKFQIFCVFCATVNEERFLINYSGMLL